MVRLNRRTFREMIIDGGKVRIAVAAFVAVLLAFGAFACGVRAYSARRELNLAEAERARTLASIPSPPAPVNPRHSESQISEGIFLTLQPQGFYPSEVTRPAGGMPLLINNRSGLKAISLNLDQQTGARLRTVALPRARRIWVERVDLQPGRYLLTEASHPGWVCTIIVTKR
ncbi:MAG: hypothetical protein AABO41_06945 [Acidobacteriota bacterium]